MIPEDVRSQYTATIGIECHVQLKTATKLFAAVGNDARDAEPNTLVSHICFGLPGALPVLNRQAVRLAIRAAFALGTDPQQHSSFDRKHYFYPDLPLGYQITQFEHPIIRDGFVDIEVQGAKKRISVREAHLEADAGKSTHPAGGDYSLVDLNRAGTPLLEIVSGPDMHTAEEAKAYVKKLHTLMKFADVSEANLFYGNMRFDVNVSVSKTDELGTRTETKNINSFRSVEKTVEYEIKRQIEVLEKGGTIVQETRGFDDVKQRTFSQRSKEDAHDYRYFPDPDIPPIELDEALIEAVRSEMPVMPDEWQQRLLALNLNDAQITTLLDGEVESAHVSYLELIEEAHQEDEAFSKALANWFVNLELPLRHDDTQKMTHLTNQARLSLYRQVFALLQQKKLSSSNAKAVIAKLLTAADAALPNVAEFAAKHGFIQESDEGAIKAVVAKVLEENPKAAEDVKNGEMKAIGFLVGQVMKHSQGRANPALAGDLIREQLGIK